MATPPYVSYSTFRNFLDKISKKIPARVDRSLMPLMSGATQSQLMASLRYLGMVSATDQPTERLQLLAKSQGADRQRILREILETCYPFLFQDFDLQAATNNLIEKKFKDEGASGDTVRKCVAFFVAAINDAGISPPPYIKPFRGVRVRNPRIRRSLEQNPVGEGTSSSLSDENVSEPAKGDDLSRTRMLLSKFPDLNPAWPDDVKVKWFDDFRKLMDFLTEKSRQE